MPYYNPRGKTVRELEKNILKYRAFEMMIILFYIEQIKSFVVLSIRKTDEFRKMIYNSEERLPKGSKKIFQKIWQILESENILTPEESKEIQDIIDYRNQVAHSIQDLTFDASTAPFNQEHIDRHGIKYKSGLLERIEFLKKKIRMGMSSRYIFTTGFEYLLFDSAEQTYRKELRNLDKKISKLKEERQKENNQIQVEFDRINQEALNDIDPYHPDNFLENGDLSEKGIMICHRLFEMEFSDIVIAYCMRMPLNSIIKYRKKWLAKIV